MEEEEVLLRDVILSFNVDDNMRMFVERTAANKQAVFVILATVLILEDSLDPIAVDCSILLLGVIFKSMNLVQAESISRTFFGSMRLPANLRLGTFRLFPLR
jgi:hypothetical protein